MESIKKFIFSNPLVASIKVVLGLAKIPEFFKPYHSHRDTHKTLSEASLQRTSKVVQAIIAELQE